MEINIDPGKWIKPLQDYIAQLKNQTIAKDPEQLFKKTQANAAFGQMYTEKQITEITQLKDFMDRNNSLEGMIEALINTTPLVIGDYRKLMSMGKYTSAELIAKLLAHAFKSTCNVWSVYERCSQILAENNRDSNIYDRFLDKGIVDFVKLSQAILILLPANVKLPENLQDEIQEKFSVMLKSVENSAFYSCLTRKTKRLAEYWKGQVTRDLMNQNKAIPMPILQDRVKEARNTIELLHFFKIVVRMSDESKLVSSSFWRSRNLFQHYLFKENLEIFEHFETLFLSMSVVCKTATVLDDEKNKEYKLLVKGIFKSTVETYDVVFNKLMEIHGSIVKKSKSKKDGTRGFLNTQNFGDWLLRCGNVHIIGNKPSDRSDTKNLRFFKILLFYSEGFREFIRTMAQSLRGEEDLTSQIICILEQMIGEVLAFKNKEKLPKKAASSVINRGAKSIVIKPSQKTKEEEQRREREMEQHGGMGTSELQKYLQVKPTSEAILFSNEQDEERGYKMKRKTHNKKLDDKTKSYLEYIKQYQYNDEYDDSLNFGTNQQKTAAKKVTMKLKVEDMRDNINEDDLEDEDLTYNNNRRGGYYGRNRGRGGSRGGRGGRGGGRGGWNNNYHHDDQGDRSVGGRGRGGFNRRGRGHKRGGYQNKNRDANNKRDYHNNRRYSKHL